MASWVASAYSRLSVSSKAFIAMQEAQRRAEQGERMSQLVSVRKVIEPYETREDQALALRTARLSRDIASGLTKAYTAVEAGRSAVGVETRRSLRAELRSVQRTTELGHGTTATGGTFLVSVVESTSRTNRNCKFRLRVQGSAHPFLSRSVEKSPPFAG
jgi:hypothetical protein